MAQGPRGFETFSALNLFDSKKIQVNDQEQVGETRVYRSNIYQIERRLKSYVEVLALRGMNYEDNIDALLKCAMKIKKEDKMLHRMFLIHCCFN